MSNDLISRQAAIDAFMMATADGDKAEWCEYVIRQVPSVQPEQTKGKWEKGVSENGLATALFCSACNYENKQWNEWNYCPNCGAKMERET